jgi:hypothetical protein
MKAAKPVEKDNKNHHSQSKKQKAKKPVVVPLPVAEVAPLQTQNLKNLQLLQDSQSRISIRQMQTELSLRFTVHRPFTIRVPGSCLKASGKSGRNRRYQSSGYPKAEKLYFHAEHQSG